MNFADPILENKNITRRGHSCELKEINQDERSIVAYGNTKSMDSYQEVLLPDGWIFDRFAKNPVMPWSHSYSFPPVGRGLWWKTDDVGLLFKGQFHTNQFADEIWQLYRDKFMNSFSVGYEQLESVRSNDEERFAELIEQYEIPGKPGLIGVKQHLWEISPVVLPANADSIVEGVKEGRIKTKAMFDTIEDLLKDGDFCSKIGHTHDMLIEIVESRKPVEKVMEVVDLETEKGEGETETEKEHPLLRVNDNIQLLFDEISELKEVVCTFSSRLEGVEGVLKEKTSKVLETLEVSSPEVPEVSVEEAMQYMEERVGELIGGEIRKLQGKID